MARALRWSLCRRHVAWTAHDGPAAGFPDRAPSSSDSVSRSPIDAGNFVTDLKPDDFEVLEDGVPQAIQLFARGDEAESAPELHIGLLFDTSGSMGDDITLARSAAVKFLNTLTDAKDMTLVDFDTEVRVAKYEQAISRGWSSGFAPASRTGATALYDALGVYLTGAATTTGRKILVLFTDGGDTRSTHRPSATCMTLVRASDVTVYAVRVSSSTSRGHRAPSSGSA